MEHPLPLNLEMPKAMEPVTLDEIIEGHVLGARHAKQAGMDGVEIHSGYGGYLLASFLSPFSSDRTDEYGGSLENRMQIVLRAIEAVRAEVGPHYLVGMKLQGHDFSPGGLEAGDAQAIAAVISATGAIDYIVVKAATCYEAHQNVPDMQHEKVLWASLAAAVREVVDVPVIAVGRINDAHDAERVLRDGVADMVAMTRQQIADPDTANKIRAGRLADIRPGIGCNQGCIDRLFDLQHSSCGHNPAAAYELELGAGTLRAADPAGHIVVVGAGPAGMKAAKVAARGGNRVTLLERRRVTGGQLRLAERVAGRSEIGGVVEHLDHQLAGLEVDIRLGCDLPAQEIVALEPTRVIVATGSAPSGEIVGNRAQDINETPGLEDGRVCSVWDVLEHGREVGQRVMIVDDGEGSWKSLGLAFELHAGGHEVEFVTPTLARGRQAGAVQRPAGDEAAVCDPISGYGHSSRCTRSTVTAPGSSSRGARTRARGWTRWCWPAGTRRPPISTSSSRRWARRSRASVTRSRRDR